MIILNIFIILLIAISFVLITDKDDYISLRLLGIVSSSLIFFLAQILVYIYTYNSIDMHVTDFFEVLVIENFMSFGNISFVFGLDGISLYFFYLSSLLILLCVLSISNEKDLKQYLINLLVIEFFLLIIFSSLDLLLFYIVFEAILVPMFLIIGIYGSRERKIRANYLFFFYTLASSIFCLIALFYIYIKTGTFSFEYLMFFEFTEFEEKLIWFAFFLAFASKIPMFPLHIWLPEAHVEAPTVGSVLLAGILLKLGVYGFLRFNFCLFPYASNYFSPLIYTLCVLGIIYASFTAIRQTDFKRIIAYSSIAHMNLVSLGVFSLNSLGIVGALFQSISHGFVASGLFFLIGVLYSRYHSRFIYYYGGLVHCMPLYSLLFLIFTLANIAVPGTSSFVGEFLLLVGIYMSNPFIAIIASIGVILSGAYSLWLYNRIIFGNIKEKYTFKFYDITFKEFLILFPLIFFTIYLGIYPDNILNIIQVSVNSIISIC